MFDFKLAQNMKILKKVKFVRHHTVTQVVKIEGKILKTVYIGIFHDCEKFTRVAAAAKMTDVLVLLGRQPGYRHRAT